MAWLELKLDTNSDQAPIIENALLECGALAVTYTDAGDQPILEPGVGEMPLWPDIVLVALYEGDIVTKKKIQELAHHCKELGGQPLPNHRWNILEDKVWEREWLKHHKPVQFGDAFWVFHERVKDQKRPTLLLDPGLAFGTGSHPTTALCLEWIAQQNWDEHKQLIDYGCGSGILAVAAALMGCEYVQCTDIDPQALIATRSNADRNQIERSRIDLFLATQEPGLVTDALVANILAGPLVELAQTFAKKLRTGGLICLSGILATQEQDILEAYTPWFHAVRVKNQDGWLRVTGVKKAP